MKKKFILGLIITTIISIYSISGTYARYTETLIDKTDSARTAKWDLNITRDIDLFSDSYVNKTNDQIVKSTNNDFIVAPGTSGEYTFTITGAPETNYTLRIEVLEALDTVGRITYSLDGIYNDLDINTLNFFLENLLREYDVYPANKPLKVNKHTISWKWNFYEDDEKDKLDTEKGNSAITDNNDIAYDTQPMVKLKVKVIAEQSTKAANINLD